MKAVLTALNNPPDTTFLTITDPTKATAADIQQADTVSTFLHKLQDQLVALKPPAQAADLNTKFVSAFEAEVKTIDDFIGALKNKDAATMKTDSATLAQQASNLTQLGSQLGTALGG